MYIPQNIVAKLPTMRKSVLLIAMLFFYLKASSQLSNEGLFYVAPDASISVQYEFNNLNTGEFWNNGTVNIFNNWTNNGVVDYTVASIDSGVFNFIGSTSQVVSGANFNNMYDVVFDNASTIDLQGNINVTNSSSFINGIVDNKISTGMFIFDENADHFNTSNLSYVNGDVIKNGDTAFDFPIGNGGFYRAANISGPDNVADTFASEYFLEDTNVNYPVANLGPNLEFVNTTEHWVLDRVSGTSQVFLTLQRNTNTTAFEILNAPLDKVHIVRWDTTLLEWVDQGGLEDTTNDSVSALVEDYGVFTLAIEKETATSNVPFPTLELPLYPLYLTPNDDTFNDTWNINPTPEVTILTLQIFDRYGKLLKQINPYGAGWDGTYNNNPMPTSDYWFIATYKNTGEDTVREHRSHFTLKR